jgi:hypothetical protein
MSESEYLSGLVNSSYRGLNLQVVFTDIVKYSERKTTMQRKVIESFTRIATDTLESLGKKSKDYSKYAKQKKRDFAADSIKIPTGDGLVVVFPSFEGLEKIHLDFALSLLQAISKHNNK